MESVKNLYWPSRRTPSQFLALTEEHTNIKNLIEFFQKYLPRCLVGGMGGWACWVLVIITLVLAVGPVRADQVYLLTSQMMNDEEN